MVYPVIEEPYEMLLLPGPRVVSLPALIDCGLDNLRLGKMALTGGMRSSQHAS